MRRGQLAFRWNIGDVSLEGFEALRLSVWGVYNAFGPRARYAIAVSALPVETARWRAVTLPPECCFYDVTGDLPRSLRAMLEASGLEHLAWRFAAPRMFPRAFEVALDNECILWARPPTLMGWLDSRGSACLLAADDGPFRGAFDPWRHQLLHARLRGMPPGFDAAAALERALDRRGGEPMTERDQEALLVSALELEGPAHVVGLDELSVARDGDMDAFRLGRCGAVFEGLNECVAPPGIQDAPNGDAYREAFRRVRPDLYDLVGIRPMGAATCPPSVTLERRGLDRATRLAS